MWRVFKKTLGIPLIAGLTIVQAMLTFLCFLGSFATTILALLMYFTLGMRTLRALHRMRMKSGYGLPCGLTLAA